MVSVVSPAWLCGTVLRHGLDTKLNQNDLITHVRQFVLAVSLTCGARYSPDVRVSRCIAILVMPGTRHQQVPPSK